MSTTSLGKAIATCSCPKCRNGKLFPVSAFSFNRLTAVNKHCEVCGANLIPEPGFYDGAMYISYAFSVALVITSMVSVTVLVKEPKLWMYIGTVVVLNIFLLPAMLRYSKTLYQYAAGKLKYRGF
ncbi:uncharacterized protein DUF983 [Algoriphagus boseongensis]|uniref:Uncharacterized protein DUF983 n=1 Tax=Algoriphagus boseongensis TaxID=1442587 RepID=A0A4R6TB65_9BACT|nr:DUF983 domain-containing protein [Algoriphagus boseongensis]TDQ19232.1 uncharacterized protein DUF983 [Algoriphagus boseongensis]